MAKRPVHNKEFDQYCEMRDFFLGAAYHGLSRHVIVTASPAVANFRATLRCVLQSDCMDMVFGAALEEGDVHTFRLLMSPLDADRFKIAWEDGGYGHAEIKAPDPEDPDGRHWLIYQVYRLVRPSACRADEMISVLSRRRL